jgi:hypothetical protein
MQIVRSLYRCAVVIVFGICAVGLLAVTTSAQNAFNSGSTGADGALDVHFISSLPVMQRSACKAWADKRHVQIVWAVR